ncbi:alpha/beta hydrolase-fold protein [Rhodocyclus tenuis]|uniref:alpha/beta hydrolase-fold protein n=1 Tax=Rhodocyclus tenuis TaxID=1066 RepID=UPI001907393C|nr:alpha/beta hydrolase-fold protein [Rhodocyclus tenuis]
MTMRTLVDRFDTARRQETLLVLLPPAQAQLEDFIDQGFVGEVRARGIATDILMAEVGYAQVMAGTVVAALREHVILPAQASGYRSIWFAGISLGAFNALYYAAAHPGDLAGVHLLAPYPGTGDILAEIAAAGGPAEWATTPQSGFGDERVWWRWLCAEAGAGQWRTPVSFGCGSEDRFLAGQRQLASLLPEERVHFVPGTHAWPTWRELWRDWFDRGSLASALTAASAAPAEETA